MPFTANTVVPQRPSLTAPPQWLLITLSLLYLLPGLTGHDPWKPDDATYIGVVFQMVKSGNWLVPALAGEPYLEHPPLYYWVSSVCAKALSPTIPFHDGARLASGLFVVATLYALRTTVRLLGRPDLQDACLLLAMGTLGLIAHAHETQPILAVLAASSFALLGFARFLQRPWEGAVVAGAAQGLAFLAGGIDGALCTLPLWVALPLCSPAWRTREAFLALPFGLVLAALIAASWPWQLHVHAPDVLQSWWSQEVKQNALSDVTRDNLQIMARLLSWHSWPVLLLAFWALWRARHHLRVSEVLLPMGALLSALVAISLAHTLRSATLLPLIPALILLASLGLPTLRRGAANALDWFAMMTWSVVALLIWLGWIAMVWGWPHRIARNFAKLEPGFQMEFSLPAVALSLLMCAGWAMLIARTPRSPMRGCLHWTAGSILAWGLTIALLLPWIDYGKTYRPIAQSLARTLADDKPECIASRGLGAPQRASFHYFANLMTETGPEAEARCSRLLVQTTGRGRTADPGPRWERVWEGRRAGDKSEIFQLFARRH